MDRLRVVVAEDHDQLRGGIVTLLSSEFQVVDNVPDGQRLIEAVLRWKPDVIITDIEMPVMDGFSARTSLLSKGIDAPFVFITLTNTVELPSDIEQGTVGFVHKIDLMEELAMAVQSVAHGESYLSQEFRPA
jgi:DNA-binding NarL/FixJ family response regulator